MPPTEPPIVQLTSPANGSELDISTLDVTGTARGEGLLPVATIRIEWLRPPEQSTAPVFTSTVALTGTVAANRFITLHPGHKDTGYAYYLIAVSNYNKISDTKRDQSATSTASLPSRRLI